MTNPPRDSSIRLKTILSYLHHPSTPEWYKNKLRDEFIKTYVIDQMYKINLEERLKGGLR